MPKVTIAQNILAANEAIAHAVRSTLQARHIPVLNMMSSPGAGKTTLLECSIALLQEYLNIAVIEGDVETSFDAERIEAAGAQVVQINTRGACHLEAHMIRDALTLLDLQKTDLLIIENIGNLVCPSSWDLGEDVRIIITSTAEGDDKPAKYPQMFATSQVMVVNKLDLLPYVDYNLENMQRQARAINPDLCVFELSCRTGTGLDAWCTWLRAFTRSIEEYG